MVEAWVVFSVKQNSWISKKVWANVKFFIVSWDQIHHIMVGPWLLAIKFLSGQSHGLWQEKSLWNRAQWRSPSFMGPKVKNGGLDIKDKLAHKRFWAPILWWA